MKNKIKTKKKRIIMKVELLHWSNVKELYEYEDLKGLLSFNFYITGITRAVLQELCRTRIASYGIKSSRYTLKKDLKNELPFKDLVQDRERAEKYIKFTNNASVDKASMLALENLRLLVNEGIPNDVLKYAMPECYLVDLAFSVNYDGLANFLYLRTSPHALAEIRELAYNIYDALPEECKPLLKDKVYPREAQ